MNKKSKFKAEQFQKSVEMFYSEFDTIKLIHKLRFIDRLQQIFLKN